MNQQLRGNLLTRRTLLLGGLALFALVWTLLMGWGVATTSTPQGPQSGAPSGAAGIQITYVDDSDFPKVRVYMAINDSSGQPMLGLGQNDFALREDGSEVPIIDFGGAGASTTTSVLVIDQSGSMADEDKMEGAIDAAQTYISFLGAGRDRIGVVSFSNWASTIADVDTLTEPRRAQINNAIAGLYPDGGTEFYNTVEQAVAMLQAEAGRKLVIALTDGMDNNGTQYLGNAVDAAKAANVPVYTVGLGRDLDRGGLEMLAQQTGGQSFFSPTAQELRDLYLSIATNLRNEYELTYRSATPYQDGTRRALDVTIGQGSSALQASGDYSTAGILSSQLNLGLFLPVLALLAGLLAVAYMAPAWRTRRTVEAAAGGEARGAADAPAPAAVEVGERPMPRGAEQPAPVRELPRAPVPAPVPIPAPVAAPVAAAMPPVQAAPAVAAIAPAGVAATATAPELALPPALVVEYPITAEKKEIWGCNDRFGLPTVVNVYETGGRPVVAPGRVLPTSLPEDVQISYNGDPGQLRPLTQPNAMRDGSLVEAYGLQCVCHAGPPPYIEARHPLDSIRWREVGNALEQHLFVEGSAAAGKNSVALNENQGRWIVTVRQGACAVSFNGDPARFVTVTTSNALKHGSLLRVNDTCFRVDLVGRSTP